MSDDTTKTDGFGAEVPGGAAQGAAAERVAFCQDCGKPLTSETVRTVGTGVFCEPCLTSRVGSTIPSQGYTTPPYTPVPPLAAVSDEPRPVLAAVLGFIPGVGAMYNGQFAKGIVHLAIFAVLVSLSDNVNGIFALFVAGWEFYMVFEAYHTAVARRDGLTLPNAFGFNDIGERMGFGRSWAAGSARPPVTNVPPASGTPSGAYPNPGNEYVPVSTYSQYANAQAKAPDWIGYVPPTAFASSPPTPQAPPAASSAAAQPSAAWSHTPYAETYTGSPQGYEPASQERPDLAARRFPASALWLIGLGVLVLIANLLPDWKLTERWWPPVLFACLSVWTFTRRRRPGTRLVCVLRWPVLLMVLAVMLALHAAYFEVTTTLTVAVLLIAYGALLLLERAAGPGFSTGPVNAYPAAAAPYQPSSTAADPRDEEARSRAAWAAANDAGVRNEVDGKNTDSGEERR